VTREESTLPEPTAAPYISVVIPVFNEEETLQELYDRLTRVLTADGRPYEIIFVDDGSRDRSLGILRALHESDARVRVVVLSRNFGQSPALYAGFSYVRGRQAVMLDADLQNPPEEIPKVLAKLDEGYDVVSGWRQQRQDTYFRRSASRALNAFIGKITGVPIHDYGCALKAFQREVVDRLLLFTHRSRYLPVDVAWLGVRIAEVEIEHNERSAGQSKYGFGKLVHTAFDLITGITGTPIHFIGMIGWGFSLIGFFMAAVIAYKRLMWGNFNPLATVAALFFFLAGVQMVATGLMCEYISRIYTEVQGRPYFVVRNVID
jgi:undecaprenyl-phosphate 4-deoxy-4-formamido-L-arabinose transferase